MTVSGTAATAPRREPLQSRLREPLLQHDLPVPGHAADVKHILGQVHAQAGDPSLVYSLAHSIRPAFAVIVETLIVTAFFQALIAKMQSKEKFEQDLAKRIDKVFADHPEIRDHRKKHSWLTGSLGDPYSGIWFVAESPSLSKIEATTKREMNSGRVLTPNSQWGTTKGSQVFRKTLVKAGFKDPEWNSSAGWYCYVTNVIKEAVYVKKWTKEKKIEAAETWAPVLRWQLQQSSPKLVVLMGGTVEKLMRHLERQDMVVLPPTKRIHHYSYIAFRAEGKLGPMHPDRIKEYEEAILDIRREFNDFYVSKEAR